MAEQQAQSPQNVQQMRQRDERALEQLVQDSAARWTDIQYSTVEMLQKQLAFNHQIANYWAESFQLAQGTLGQFANTIEKQRRQFAA